MKTVNLETLAVFNQLMPKTYFCTSIKSIVLINKCYKQLTLTFLTH